MIITLRLTRLTSPLTFDILLPGGHLLKTGVPWYTLKEGLTLSVPEGTHFLTIRSGALSKEVPVNGTSRFASPLSIWRHLETPSLYNSFYGATHPFILEHSLSFQGPEQIVHSIQDYTRAFTFQGTQRVASDAYYNRAILYNDHQSSGYLTLVPKPAHNLQSYLTYPRYREDSKEILFTKSASLYQYNTFWDITLDSSQPLFTPVCTSLSQDKEPNILNLDYTTRSFHKSPLRGRYLKVRHIQDTRSDLHLTSTFLLSNTQNSYK